MKMSRPVETSKATQSMKQPLIPGEFNPEQRYNDEFKFRKKIYSDMSLEQPA
jgi:hypothetical protein